MTQEELTQLAKDNKVETVQPTPADSTPAIQDQADPLKEISDLISSLRQLKRNLTAVPTVTPYNSLEQIKLVNSELYIYFDKTVKWKKIGSLYATGYATRTTGNGTGAQQITTGFEPKLIKITAVANGNNGGTSWGSATSTSTNNCVTNNFDGTYWTHSNYANIIYVWNSGGTSNAQANISAIDATSFTLDWTQMAVAAKFIWEAFG